MSWLNAIAWVPHHIAGALSCLTALMVFQFAINKDKRQLPLAAIVSGIAFASAVGLSFWTMFVFAFFWVLWIIVLFLKKADSKVLWMMIIAAILGLILVAPFLIGIMQSGNSSGEGLVPVKLYVRPFVINKFISFLPQWIVNIINFLFLPINYLFELGFYFAIAILWFQERKAEWRDNPYFVAEVLLIITVVLLLSFIRSTIIVINDLGIRGWLFGQFVLVIWAVDVLEKQTKKYKILSPAMFNLFKGSRWLGAVMYLMLAAGLFTTSLEVISIRLWPILIDLGVAGFPTGLSLDNQLGRRTYDARLAYQFIAESVPEDIIVQYNPIIFLDRPSGLYGNHQMALADYTAYGIAIEEFQSRVEKISAIFQEDNYSDWSEIDKLCHQYYVDVLVFNDTDPIWQNMDILIPQRTALYKNQFYAVFSCGNP